MRVRHNQSRRDARVRLLLLAAGQEVEVPCRLRRTSARGWGSWTNGVLVLSARGEHRAEWRADDALAVGLTPSRALKSFRVTDVVSVVVRPARFREESFHGADTDIVVVTSERSVTEFCVPPEEVEEVFQRLGSVIQAPPDEA
jgi:hypothetical protein